MKQVQYTGFFHPLSNQKAISFYSKIYQNIFKEIDEKGIISIN